MNDEDPNGQDPSTPTEDGQGIEDQEFTDLIEDEKKKGTKGRTNFHGK